MGGGRPHQLNPQTHSGRTPQSSNGAQNPSQTPSVERNEKGNVVLPNGQEVNGFGTASRNSDGGVTFTSQGSDGSKSIDSYDKDGNRSVQTFDKNGEMTSSFRQNQDGSSSGFIKKEDGSVDQWDDKPGTFKNVGAIQERNEKN